MGSGKSATHGTGDDPNRLTYALAYAAREPRLHPFAIFGVNDVEHVEHRTCGELGG